jgi:CheY-like chemotaxis protein
LAELLDMCQVITKTRYEDAVVYLNNNSPDLAILDIMGVNGFELLKLCVEKEIPAVMLTAHAFSVESLKESLELGASAYLPKEKMAEIVSFLEDVVTLEHKENWERLFKRLGTFLNATFGGEWNKDLPRHFRTHLKNVFWPNIFVGASLQILDIQQYASGLRPTKIIRSGGKSSNAGKLGPAARVPAKPLGEDGILNQNPIFEMGFSYVPS